MAPTFLMNNTAAALVTLGNRALLHDFHPLCNPSIWLRRLARWNKINATGRGRPEVSR